MAFSLGALDWWVCALVLSSGLFFRSFLSHPAKASANSSRFFLPTGAYRGRWLARRCLQPTSERNIWLAFPATPIAIVVGGNRRAHNLLDLGFAAFFLFPFYIRNRVFTTPEFLETRFHPLARVLFSGLMLVIAITKTAFHLYAGALVLRGLTGWDVMTVAGGYRPIHPPSTTRTCP